MSTLGVFTGVLLSILLTFDGFLYGTGILNKSGSLNIYIATLLLIIFVGFILIQVNNAIRLLSRPAFLVLSICIVIFIFSALLSNIVALNTLKLVRDLIYISTYFIVFFAFIVISFHPGQKIFFLSFFKVYFIINLLVFPILAILLVFFHPITGRFEGVYGAPTLSGNITALLAGYLILKGREYFSFFMVFILIVTSIALIFLTGTRSALIIVLLAFVLKGVAGAGKKYVLIALCVSFICSGILIYLYMDIISIFIEQSVMTNRILSVDDVEGGSLATRINWYSLLFNQIVESNFLGGFGPGAAENNLGYIPHFDFLKNYYDYSIVGGGIYMIIILLFCRNVNIQITAYSFLTYLMISLHNAFLVPVLMINWIFIVIGLLNSKTVFKHSNTSN